MTNRRPVHTRTVRAEAFVRDDGLWDLEAELVDTKARDFRLASGMRPAGAPIHRMRLSITIDTTFAVRAATARSIDHPYPGSCETIEPDYGQLVGLNLLRGFKRDVRARLGGVAGCTHLTELTDVLPTLAVQAFAGEVVQPDGDDVGAGAAGDRKPFQLDQCHALRSDAPAVARFYPRWYRPATDESTRPSATVAAPSS